MDTISVIVAIYKVEKYLRKCLDTIINQTYKKLEIILVDDGSPDQCNVICDEYAEKDSRIHVIHKQNGGLSAAWNDGLAMSTGDWIAFVDSDDWLELDYFDRMIEETSGEDLDLVQTSGFFREKEDQQSTCHFFMQPFIFYNGAGKNFMILRTLSKPKEEGTDAAFPYAWGKLYRASLLRREGFRFDPKIRAGLANDAVFNIAVYLKAVNVKGISYYGYHYRVAAESGTLRFDPNRPENESYVDQQLEKLIIHSDVSGQLQKALELFYLRDVFHNLARCYFHPDNPANRREIANGIRKMKQMHYYRMGIEAKDNPFIGTQLKVFQLALKLPWIWPLRCAVTMWQKLENRE